MPDNRLAAVVGRDHFAGGSKLTGKHDGSLSEIIRGIAIDMARTKIESSSVSDVTDSSGGTDLVATTGTMVLPALTIPDAPYDGSSSGAAPGAAFATGVLVNTNSIAALADHANDVCARLGLPQVSGISTAAGFTYTAGTIASMTKTLTATNGATAVAFSTGRPQMIALRNEFMVVARQINSILAALGAATFTYPVGGYIDPTLAFPLTDYSTVTSGTGSPAGSTSISDTVMDAFLTNLANGIAMLAGAFNRAVGAVDATDITNSVGGTATYTLPALAIPTPAAGAATTSAPKAGFDTELAKFRNNFKEISTKLNPIRARLGMPLLIDNAAGTANATAEAHTVALTAVDGSSGTSAVEQESAIAALTACKNNLQTVAVAVNEVLGYFGQQQQVINIGGTASPTRTIVAMADTATGVGDDTDPVTLLDADVDAALVIIRTCMVSLVDRVNDCIGAAVQSVPLNVVAGD